MKRKEGLSLASLSAAIRGDDGTGASSFPYTSLGRHRSSSTASASHNRQYHLPRRRNSASSHLPPSLWTLSTRTRRLIVAFVLLAVAFITGITKLIIYILNPDKEPKTWQYFCTSQQDFPHALADSLAPVDVFVGVFSIDSSYERRQLIRSTYASLTLPHDVHTGAQLTNVQLKFILGRPRKLHARRVALEMEAYNDIVVLDMEENMNQGKTHAYFRWAAENATVPILLSQEPKSPSYPGATLRSTVAWKKADYVVKADDDAFIVLSELERHLRVSPRTGTYWGYLIRNWFMGGECYALSNDLVQYIATSPDVARYTHGKEDKKVAQWMNLHPNATSLNWVSERCWIYDGPKAGTAYSHGYLFPDYVAKLKMDAAKESADAAEGAASPGEEVQGASSTNGLVAEPRRSAEWRRKHSASTVSRWKQPYVVPRAGMTIEEEVEALVEGGGRWDGLWLQPARAAASPFDDDAYHAGLAPILTSFGATGNEVDVGAAHSYAALHEDFSAEPRVWVPFDSLVFEANDPRLRPVKEGADAPLFRTDVDSDPTSGLALYNLTAIPHAGLLSPRAVPVVETAPLRKRASIAGLDDLDTPRDRRRDDPTVAQAGAEQLIPSRNVPLTTGGRQALSRGTTSLGASGGGGGGGGSTGALKGGGDAWQHLSYYESPTDVLGRGNLTPEQRLRARRYLFRPYGGTVVVHYLKKSEWFLETAIALLGKDNLWPEPNAGAAARMQHSAALAARGGGGASTGPATGAGAGAGAVDALGGRAREWRMWGSPMVVPGPTDKEARIL
ncbi:hypothetical protein OC834_005288 [Tilletia horrida]|nr:hypothetical protein OC834_005288 [Tilletia horrida]